MEDIDEPSGSVVLQPKGGDMSFNAELTSRNRLLKEQRFEMAENQVKRTRHPFSGYKQLLNYDRTEPKVKMIKRNPTTSKSGLDEEMMGGEINTTVTSNQGVIYPYPRLSQGAANDKKQANLEAYKSQKPDTDSIFRLSNGNVRDLVQRGIF